jgi:hypothetical protein
MNMQMLTKTLLGALACVPALAALPEPTPQTKGEDVPRSKAVDSAMAYVLEKGEAWIKERKCVSCHMIPFTVWSLNEAKRQGYALPGARVEGLIGWTHQDAKRESPLIEGLSFLVIASAENQSEPEISKDVASFAQRIAGAQNPNGTWNIGGQTPEQKRPMAESVEVVTMWAMLALNLAHGQSAQPAIERGLKTISSDAGKVSNEWYVARLRLAQRLGDSKTETRILSRLLELQNDDWGWGWLVGDPSDAIATGQSLYALSFSKGGRLIKPLALGRGFLLRTQESDGSWPANSTLDDKKTQVIPTSAYWATTWAAIGLCRSEGSP